MTSLSIFATHFVSSFPNLADFLTGLALIAVFIGGPIIGLVLLSSKINKGRFVFEKRQLQSPTGNGEHLYMLDTMTGHLFYVEGHTYYRKMIDLGARRQAEQQAQKQ